MDMIKVSDFLSCSGLLSAIIGYIIVIYYFIIVEKAPFITLYFFMVGVICFVLTLIFITQSDIKKELKK